MHGYQIIQELAARTDDVWRPSPGSVYPTLQQLEDEGLVRGEQAEGRRVFHLTDEGRAEVQTRDADQPAPWQVGDGAGPLMDLRSAGFSLFAAVMQVAQTGTQVQVTRAIEVLNEARRRLYAMLGEDAPPAGGDAPSPDAAG